MIKTFTLRRALKPNAYPLNFLVKNYLFTLSVFVLTAVGMFSCVGNQDIVPRQVNTYLAIDSLMSEKVAELTNNSGSLTKTAVIKNKTETQTIDQPNWERELTVFLALNLNKPAWQEGFKVDTVQNNDNKTVTYLAKEEDITIKKLAVTYQNNKLHKLSSQVASNNLFYSASKELRISFNKYEQIENYQVSGFQKILWFDESQFVVKGQASR